MGYEQLIVVEEDNVLHPQALQVRRARVLCTGGWGRRLHGLLAPCSRPAPLNKRKAEHAPTNASLAPLAVPCLRRGRAQMLSGMLNMSKDDEKVRQTPKP